MAKIPFSPMCTTLFLYASVLTFTFGFANPRHVKNDIFNIGSREHETLDIEEKRNSSDEDDDDENQTWIIIGVVCGTVLAAIIIIVVMLCLCRRKLGKGDRQWFWTRRSEVKASAKPVIIMEMSRVNQPIPVPVPVPVSPPRPSTDAFPTAPSSVSISSISTFPDPPTPAATTFNGDDDFYQGPFNPEFQPVYEELPPPYDFAVAVHEPTKVKL